MRVVREVAAAADRVLRSRAGEDETRTGDAGAGR
jgi:hypothetical protein